MAKRTTVELPAIVTLQNGVPVAIVVRSPDGQWTFETRFYNGYVDYWKYTQQEARP